MPQLWHHAIICNLLCVVITIPTPSHAVDPQFPTVRLDTPTFGLVHITQRRAKVFTAAASEHPPKITVNSRAHASFGNVFGMFAVSLLFIPTLAAKALRTGTSGINMLLKPASWSMAALGDTHVALPVQPSKEQSLLVTSGDAKQDMQELRTKDQEKIPEDVHTPLSPVEDLIDDSETLLNFMEETGKPSDNASTDTETNEFLQEEPAVPAEEMPQDSSSASIEKGIVDATDTATKRRSRGRKGSKNDFMLDLDFGWPDDVAAQWAALDETAEPSAASVDPMIVKRCGKGIRYVFKRFAPSKEDIVEKQALVAALERSLNGNRSLRPCRVKLYGSWVSTLVTKDSDMDLCLLLEKPPRLDERQKVMYRIANLLRQNGYDNVVPIIRAAVPIIKFRHIDSKTEMDLSVNFEPRFTLAIYASRLLHAYASFDAVVRPLALVIKHWSRCRGINDAQHGLLTSHGWVLMLLSWLQRGARSTGPVLPDLQSSGAPKEFVAWCNVGFRPPAKARKAMGRPEVASPRMQNGLLMPTDDAVLFDLLAGFFHYYAQHFDTRRDVVRLHPGVGGTQQCDGCGRHLSVTWFIGEERKQCRDCVKASRHSRARRSHWPLAIEDPIDVSRDVAAVLGREGQWRVFRELDRAWRVLVTTGSLRTLCDPKH